MSTYMYHSLVQMVPPTCCHKAEESVRNIPFWDDDTGQISGVPVSPVNGCGSGIQLQKVLVSSCSAILALSQLSAESGFLTVFIPQPVKVLPQILQDNGNSRLTLPTRATRKRAVWVDHCQDLQGVHVPKTSSSSST